MLTSLPTEIVQRTPGYDPLKADIFSLGPIILRLLGKVSAIDNSLWVDLTSQDNKGQYRKLKPDEVKTVLKKRFQDGKSDSQKLRDEWIDLLKRMLCRATDRLDIASVINEFDSVVQKVK